MPLIVSVNTTQDYLLMLRIDIKSVSSTLLKSGLRAKGVAIYWRYSRDHTESIEVSKGCKGNQLLRSLPPSISFLVLCVTSVIYLNWYKNS